VDCPLCRNLKSELDRLERIHAEKLAVLLAQAESVRGQKHRSLRIAVNDALLNLEVARAKLNRHLLEHQAHLTAP
jgi:hypothetical protein